MIVEEVRGRGEHAIFPAGDHCAKAPGPRLRERVAPNLCRDLGAQHLLVRALLCPGAALVLEAHTDARRRLAALVGAGASRIARKRAKLGGGRSRDEPTAEDYR